MGRRIHWSKDGTILRNQEPPGSIAVVSSTFCQSVDDAKYIYGGIDAGTYLNDNYHYLTWEFPDFVSIDQVRLCMGYNHGDCFNTFTFYTSLNSSDGLDGTWTHIGTGGGFDMTSGVEYVYNLTPVGSSRWLRCTLSGDAYGNRGWYTSDMTYLHLFGDYDNEPYVLYDNETVPAPITDWDYFLSSPAAPDGIFWDSQDNSLHKEIQIKNTSGISQAYIITCDSGVYAHTDTVITDHYKVWSVSSPTPLASFTTPSVAPDAFSEVINIDYTLDAVDNPANGKHYFRVRVERAP